MSYKIQISNETSYNLDDLCMFSFNYELLKETIKYLCVQTIGNRALIEELSKAAKLDQNEILKKVNCQIQNNTITENIPPIDARPPIINNRNSLTSVSNLIPQNILDLNSNMSMGPRSPRMMNNFVEDSRLRNIEADLRKFCDKVNETSLRFHSLETKAFEVDTTKLKKDLSRIFVDIPSLQATNGLIELQKDKMNQSVRDIMELINLKYEELNKKNENLTQQLNMVANNFSELTVKFSDASLFIENEKSKKQIQSEIVEKEVLKVEESDSDSDKKNIKEGKVNGSIKEKIELLPKNKIKLEKSTSRSSPKLSKIVSGHSESIKNLFQEINNVKTNINVFEPESNEKTEKKDSKSQNELQALKREIKLVANSVYEYNFKLKQIDETINKLSSSNESSATKETITAILNRLGTFDNRLIAFSKNIKSIELKLNESLFIVPLDNPTEAKEDKNYALLSEEINEKIAKIRDEITIIKTENYRDKLVMQKKIEEKISKDELIELENKIYKELDGLITGFNRKLLKKADLSKYNELFKKIKKLQNDLEDQKSPFEPDSSSNNNNNCISCDTNLVNFCLISQKLSRDSEFRKRRNNKDLDAIISSPQNTERGSKTLNLNKLSNYRSKIELKSIKEAIKAEIKK